MVKFSKAEVRIEATKRFAGARGIQRANIWYGKKEKPPIILILTISHISAFCYFMS